MSSIKVEKLTIELTNKEARNVAYAIKNSLIASIDEHYVRFPDNPKLIDEQNGDLFNIMNNLIMVANGERCDYLDREVREYLKNKLAEKAKVNPNGDKR